MPENSEILEVTIKTRREDRKKCDVAPTFRAKRGSEVNFVFDEFPDADIIFTKGPFATDKFKPSKQKVRMNVPRPAPGTESVRFEYTVEWPGGGQGGGQGEVIGG